MTGYEEGLQYGAILVARVLAGVSLILMLSLSTSIDRLLKALAWFRLPSTFVEIGLLIYRYIFVLGDELINVQNAQRTRLAYQNWTQSMRSLSMLSATVILRAYDRAERVFTAMTVRGYTGKPVVINLEFNMKDISVTLLLATVLAVFFFIGQIV